MSQINIEEFAKNIRPFLLDVKKKWDSRDKNMSREETLKEFRRVIDEAEDPILPWLESTEGNQWFRYVDYIMGYIEDGRYTLDEAVERMQRYVFGGENPILELEPGDSGEYIRERF